MSEKELQDQEPIKPEIEEVKVQAPRLIPGKTYLWDNKVAKCVGFIPKPTYIIEFAEPVKNLQGVMGSDRRMAITQDSVITQLNLKELKQ